MYYFEEVCADLGHKRTTNAEMAVELLNLANEKDGYNIVTWNESIEVLFGSTKFLKPFQIEKHRQTIEDILDKTMVFAGELQPDKPVMVCKDWVEAKPQRIKGDDGKYIRGEDGKFIYEEKKKLLRIGFKIKTKDDEEYVRRNAEFTQKFVNGLINNGKTKINENANVGMISNAQRDLALDALSNASTSSKALLNGATVVEDGCFEQRQAILLQFEHGDISRRECDYQLSQVCK